MRRWPLVGALAAAAVVAVSVASAAPPGGSKVTLSVTDVAATEGDTGSCVLAFTVSASGSLKGSASVSFATANVSAAAAEDYPAISGSLTFDRRTKNRTVTVQITGDTVDEQDETFESGSRTRAAQRSRTASASARSWTTTARRSPARRSRQRATSPAIPGAPSTTAGWGAA